MFESDRTLIECPSCHVVAPKSSDPSQGALYCFKCRFTKYLPLPASGRQLIATVGLPRSGKSTWSKANGNPMVNLDSIRLALHGQAWYPPAEPWVMATAGTMIEALFQAGHKTVIFDATMTARWKRQLIVDRYGKNIVWKVFHTPSEVCRERARALGQDDLIPVIDKMLAQYDFGLDPDTDRHSDVSIPVME